MLRRRESITKNKKFYIFSIIFGLSFAVWSLLSLHSYSHTTILNYTGIYYKYEEIHKPGFAGGSTANFFYIGDQVFHIYSILSFDMQFFENIKEGDVIAIEYIEVPRYSGFASSKTDKLLLSVRKGTKYYLKTESTLRTLNRSNYLGIGLGMVFAIGGLTAIIFDLK
jgi:hypothetical protein